MKFSLNNSNENFTFNDSRQYSAIDDASYKQKDHLNIFNGNLGKSSLNGWSRLPNMINISNHYHQSRIPLIPNQNNDSLDTNLVISQNHLVYNTPTFEIPSNTTVSESIKNTTRQIMNQHEDQKMINTNQKKNKNVARRSKPLQIGNTNKGKWDEYEDRKLKELVELYGQKKWRMIAKSLEGRIGKQCRDRWYNHLCPNIKKGDWSKEEDQILINIHKVVGTKWTKIAQHLPGRSENTIKNHWNTTKRRMQKQYSNENANPATNNNLENYLRYFIINNNDLAKTSETDGKTTSFEDDDDYKDMCYGDMDSSMGARTQTLEPLVDACSTSAYVPMAETFTWENYTTEFREPMDVTQMMILGWE